MVQIDFNTDLILIKDILPPKQKTIGIDSIASTGIITERVGMFQTICKTKISAYKNNVLYDISLTDENGSYFLFLEDGIYDFKLENEKYTRWYRTQKIEQGITIHYINLDNTFDYGMIYNIYGDVIEFLNIEMNINNTTLDNIVSPYKLIIGYLVDEYNNPIENASIIVSKNNKIVSFIKTNEEGYYRFALKSDTYDIRIRHDNYAVKIFNNFTFNYKNGFMSELINVSNDFNFDGHNLKILK